METKVLDALFFDSLALLEDMIRIPSFSREEAQVADLVAERMSMWGMHPKRSANNLWAFNRNYDVTKPTILLNSHIDTVKPSNGWLTDPFEPVTTHGRLTGLGANDAGASVVSLLAVFRYFNSRSDLPFNLIVAPTAEEEITGEGNVGSILPEFGPVWLAIVGEPTGMQLAVAERGLLVLDCTVRGKSGHVAREEGINAIYEALPAIEWFRTFSDPLTSPLLGKVKMSVSQIEAGQAHNVVPDTCRFVVDIRTTELYSQQEIVDMVCRNIRCEVAPRSLKRKASGISQEHPIVKRAHGIGLQLFGSATTSDQVVMPFDSVKIGPGDSARSHTANEYVLHSEIRAGIETYIQLLEELLRD